MDNGPSAPETPGDSTLNSSAPAPASPVGSLLFFPTEEFPPISVVYQRLFGVALPDDREETTVLCQLHTETSPSFSVNLRTGAWKCHGQRCPSNEIGNGGGKVLRLVELAKTFDPEQAMRWLIQERLMVARRQENFWNDAPLPILYDYVDADGVRLYQVGRKHVPPAAKDIRQRRPKPGGGWVYNLKGVVRVPYRLPQVLRTAAQGGTIFVVEGEKDVENLRDAFGVCVTTNAQGAGWAWPTAWAEHFRGAARIVVLADNDTPGIAHAEQAAGICALAVPDTRLVGALPGVGPKGDISDWLAAGHSYDELLALIDGAPTAEPFEERYPRDAIAALVADLSDTGNGHSFKACVGDDVRWVRDGKVWMAWDGMRWTERIAEHAYTEQAVQKMRLAAVHADLSANEREMLGDWVSKSSSMTLRKNMLEAAKSLVLVESERLDAQTMLLNLRNGVLDLETYELRPHDRDLYFTKVMPIDYDADATCPNWLAWLHEAMAGDAEMIEYVQRIFGEALIGKAGLRRMFFCYGPHGTGKTTITKVLREMLGEFAGSIDFATVAQRDKNSGSSASPDIARLRGLRLITAVESRDSDKLDAARLKQFMGGDAVVARNLFAGVTEFVLQATLFFSGNERPEVQADDSFWSKLKMLPFKHQFPNQDANYFERMLAPELPGIFAWAVAGLRKLAADNWKLTDPAAVLAETLEYREDANPLQRFLEEACVLWNPTGTDPVGNYCVPVGDLRRAFQWWAESQGLRSFGERYFSNRIRHTPNVAQRKLGADGTRYWIGVRLKLATQRGMEEHRARRSAARDRGADGHEEPDF